MTQQYLIAVTVGPVQSFIAAARRMEDFWSGSYILSHLLRTAIEALYDSGIKFDLVFPIVRKEDLERPEVQPLHIASLPNRLTASVHGSEQEVVTLLRQVEAAIREEIQQIAFGAIDHVFSPLSKEDQATLKATTKGQLAHLLEVYWVIEPRSDDFQTSKLQLERRLGAIKNDKTYLQVHEQSFACSVCKSRESLSVAPITVNHSYADMKKLMHETWSQRAPKFKGNIPRIKDDEYLCGVCLMKRNARDYFKNKYSTSMLNGFRRFDSVADIAGKQEGYYAILMLDGDNMGQYLAGNDIHAYQQVSERLAMFALKTVQNIVEEQHNASIIYAGGDDVLAFMPVKSALQIAQQLRFAFSDEQQGLGYQATASVGLVIAHVKAPLQLLLDEVRGLEKKAKVYPNKNALAIGIHTRSGEISETVLPWQVSDEKTVELLQECIQLLKEDLSSTFIHHFKEAFVPLLGEQTHQKVEKAWVEVELRRLMKRSSKTKISDSKLEAIIQKLVLLHEEQDTTLQFIHLLKMMTFFGRKDGDYDEY